MQAQEVRSSALVCSWRNRHYAFEFGPLPVRERLNSIQAWFVPTKIRSSTAYAAFFADGVTSLKRLPMSPCSFNGTSADEIQSPHRYSCPARKMASAVTTYHRFGFSFCDAISRSTANIAAQLNLIDLWDLWL